MHGFDTRGSNVPAGILTPEGRFGRILPFLDARQPTGQALCRPNGRSRRPDGSGFGDDDSKHVPAGFTFLAQFLDHDLDFDPTSSLERQTDPNAITNFRTPALDLDNVYASGPMASPNIYDQANADQLLVNGTDLARNAQGKALIGDPRNDENMIVSQLELAFMKCHNAIVVGLYAGTFKDAFGAPATMNEDTTGGESTVFLAAQQLLRWHYQWMVIHEFLPLFCGNTVVDDILSNGPQFFSPQRPTSRLFRSNSVLPPTDSAMQPFARTTISIRRTHRFRCFRQIRRLRPRREPIFVAVLLIRHSPSNGLIFSSAIQHIPRRRRNASSRC